jgi:hypothetical protein
VINRLPKENAMHLSDHCRPRLTGLALAVAVAVAAAACGSSHPGTGNKAATAPGATAAPASPIAASPSAAAITPTAAASPADGAGPAAGPAVTVSPPASAATTGPAAAYSSNLGSVSCPHGSWCMAVGSWSASQQGPSRPLAEAWNGTSWQMLATPDPAGSAASSLTSVSCTSATRCMAVGDHASGTFAEAWNGTSWQILTTPTLAASSLASVSCTSARCMAVGGYGMHALAEAWNRASWQILATPDPAGTAASSLTSVSCTSAGRCMAVGYAAAVNWLQGQLPVAQEWNGAGWRILPTPDPLPGQINSFRSVSCSSASRCMAVGGSQVNQGAGPLPSFAEAWNGSHWRLVKAANPPAGRRQLTAVSCTSAARCMAVGNSTGIEAAKGSGPYAETWNGTSWRLLTVPGPGSLAYYGLGLAGVSCANSANCIAAGGFFANPGVNSSSSTLAEAWNGISWGVLRPPSP